MEKIAHEIQALLEEKLSCYRRLNSVVEDEKTHIAVMDLDGLWKTVGLKKEMAGQITTIRKQLISICNTFAIDTPMNPASFSLAYFLEHLPVSTMTRAALGKLKQDIDHVKDQVVQRARLNQVQVRKYLSVVDDIMSVVGDNSVRSQYTGMGRVSGQKQKNCLIRAEV